MKNYLKKRKSVVAILIKSDCLNVIYINIIIYHSPETRREADRWQNQREVLEKCFVQRKPRSYSLTWFVFLRLRVCKEKFSERSTDLAQRLFNVVIVCGRLSACSLGSSHLSRKVRRWDKTSQNAHCARWKQGFGAWDGDVGRGKDYTRVNSIM